ncbi:hypothetical protein GJ654_18700 [Rhodoblastus acidophilus]|uniref:Uncharacterized protein n=1 Tax=Rhodoblastus acidophilus TaxID=1074 RepID=A0A6N8DV08_RHOAC|nr:hypothetical protein [Rhodoblastus acidophilus]MCW2276358.1 hypothetical protein [Rhodoblastus acidophilus]MTV33013.1 hypothetical protein [Rhodoblastus acidophilus]
MHPAHMDKTSQNLDKTSMNLAFPHNPDDRARVSLLLLEAIARVLSGKGAEKARQIVADAIGVAGGTAENIRRERHKGVRVAIARKIDRALLRQISRIQAELVAADESGVDAGSPDALASARLLVEAQAARAQIARDTRGV